MSSNTVVTIRVKREGFEFCCYEELDKVNADILVDSQVVGKIRADVIDRSQIPENGFYEAFDSHSHDMLTIGTQLMEPRFGRTKLKSLMDHDNAQREFMYIEKFQVSCPDNKEEIATQALHQFLNHSLILGPNLETPRVTSVAYILDFAAQLTPEDAAAREAFRKEDSPSFAFNHSVDEIVRHRELKRELDILRVEGTYEDAIPFLRNGFFEDSAVSPSERCARYVVASCGDFTSPLKSSEEVRAMPFHVDPKPPELIRKDLELNAYVDQQFEITDLEATRKEIQSYVQNGANILNSDIMHLACKTGRSNLGLAKFILELEPSVINHYSSKGETPLMVAALAAFHSGDLTLVDFLLTSGADVSLRDKDGMTTFDRLKKGLIEEESLLYMRHLQGLPIPTKEDVIRLFSIMALPPGGPPSNVIQNSYRQEELNPGLIEYDDDEDGDTAHDDHDTNEDYYEDEDEDEDFDDSSEES